MKSWFYEALYGVSWLGAWAVTPLVPKVRQGVLGRVGMLRRYRSLRHVLGPKPLWFHVASAGEFEQCLPILDAVKAEAPTKKIFLSYFSPSAVGALKREVTRRELAGLTVPWDGSDFSPWDFSSYADKAMEAIDPSDLVVVHRELWPGLLGAAQRRGIRRHLVATSYHKPLAPRALAILETFSFVGTIRPDSALRLKSQLSEVPIESLGDPRIDRVLSRRGLADETIWRRELSRGPVFVGASLWDEDLEALAPLVSDILEKHPRWRIVLVPHEPTPSRVLSFASFLASRGAKVKPWSNWSREPGRDASHLVVDGVGWLAELYGAAEIVFLGGSFRKKVHSVLEPAAYGRPILTGPFISNSAEACEMAAAGVGLKRAETPELLLSKAQEWLQSEEARRQAREWLEAYLEERQGAGWRYAKHLLNSPT